MATLLEIMERRLAREEQRHGPDSLSVKQFRQQVEDLRRRVEKGPPASQNETWITGSSNGVQGTDDLPKA